MPVQVNDRVAYADNSAIVGQVVTISQQRGDDGKFDPSLELACRIRWDDGRQSVLLISRVVLIAAN